MIGAVAFALIEELVRPFGQLNVLVYGVLLIVLFTTFREGVVPLLEKLWRALPRLDLRQAAALRAEQAREQRRTP